MRKTRKIYRVKTASSNDGAHTSTATWRANERERTILTHFHRLPNWIFVLFTLLILMGLAAFIISIIAANSTTETVTIVQNITSIIEANETCPINASCLPNNITVDYLTVNDHINLYDMIHIDGDVICATPLWPSCLDISGQSCVTPLQSSCLPQDLSINDLTLGGGLTCSVAGSVGANCIDISGETCPNGPLNGNCIDISGETCPGGAIDAMCIPTILDSKTITGTTTLDGTLMCSGMGVIDSSCFVINATELGIDISGETCPGGPLNNNCIPSTLDSTTLTGTTTVTGSLTCSGSGSFNNACLDCSTPLSSTCIDISGETCPGGPLNTNCMPSELILSKLTVGELVVNDQNVTFMGVTEADMLNVDLLMSNATIFKGPVTCSQNDLISQACIDISGESCPLGSLGANCIPTTLAAKTLSGTTSVTGPLQCSGAGAVDANCIDISGEACPLGSLGANCIPTTLATKTLSGTTSVTGPLMCSGLGVIDANCIDISGEMCSAPLTDSCFPTIFTNRTLDGTTSLEGPIVCPMGGSIDSACIDISNESCPSGSLNANCIPTTLTAKTLDGTTAIEGPLVCSGAGTVSANCIDISGESCPLGSLGANCIPNNLAGKTLSGNTTLAGPLVCTVPNSIQEMCLPSTIDATTFTGSNSLLGPLTCSGAGVIGNGCLPDNITVGTSLTCNVPNAIDQACFQIDGETCTIPITDSCIPATITTTTFAGVNTLSGTLTCTTGSINANCIDISGETCTAPLSSNCIDISGETCPGGPVGTGCIPLDLVLNSLVVSSLTVPGQNVSFTGNTVTTMLEVGTLVSNYTIQSGPLVCSVPNSISQGCIDISGETCTAPIALSCIDISGHGTCTLAVDNSCVDISGETCSNPIDLSCVDISGHGTCSTPIAESCLPSTITSSTFNGMNMLTGTLTCSGLGDISQSCYDISAHGTCSAAIDETCIPNTLDATTFTGSNSLQGPLTCSGSGEIANECLPNIVTIQNNLTCAVPNVIDQMCFEIDGKTCTSPLDQSCIPTTLTGVTITNAIIDGTLTCDVGTTISPGCIDISMESCSMPINANCVDISGETCMSPVDDSCLPPRVSTINNIVPNAALNFNITGSSSVVVTSGINGITLTSPPDILSGATVCSTPLNASCIPDDDDVEKIAGVSPDVQGNVNITGANGIVITPIPASNTVQIGLNPAALPMPGLQLGMSFDNHHNANRPNSGPFNFNLNNPSMFGLGVDIPIDFRFAVTYWGRTGIVPARVIYSNTEPTHVPNCPTGEWVCVTSGSNCVVNYIRVYVSIIRQQDMMTDYTKDGVGFLGTTIGSFELPNFSQGVATFNLTIPSYGNGAVLYFYTWDHSKKVEFAGGSKCKGPLANQDNSRVAFMGLFL